MRLTPDVLDAWRHTDYRVRLAAGGFASIRCGLAPSPALRALLRDADEPWGFLTAWNPGGVVCPRAANRRRQRRLRDELIRLGLRAYAGIGVGARGWREPSLFIAGIEPAALDALARRFGQLGVLRGRGAGPAELHLPG